MPDRFSTATERDALTGMLDQVRDALVRKVRGVDEADARRTPTASSLSLLGLLIHSTVWEQRWFHAVVAGRPQPDGWPERRTPGADFVVADDDTVEACVDRYEQAIATSRLIVADIELDAPCALADIVDENVRFVLLHMIQETARHAGHADIIRETIDGIRGM